MKIKKNSENIVELIKYTKKQNKLKTRNRKIEL